MNLRDYWRASILLRVASVLGAVTLLAVGVVLAAAYITEQTTGKGAAINVAGSLRMQSYRLATRVADARGEPAARAAAVLTEVAEFERRFSDTRLRAAVPDTGPLRDTYDRIEVQWRTVRPMAIAASSATPVEARFLDAVDAFVTDIDGFVRALEEDLESRIHGLQVALGSALFVILVLIVTAFFVLDVQVFQPIKDLVRVTQRVRAGAFDVRAESAGDDELGQLGRDFNHMVEELGRLYGSLEAQIAAKTADLAQKNRSLSLLYETARELSDLSLDRATLARVAEKIRGVLHVEGVVICARQSGAPRGWPLASAEAAPGRICDAVRCAEISTAQHACWQAADGAAGTRSIVSVPLLDGETQYGVMPLMLASGQTLAPWQVELAQTLGRHLGGALAAAQARDEHRRLALLEERGAIARELHDSLAQSLSYSKIQIARLSKLTAGPPTPAAAEQTREVVQELREGVSSAYRQLRELLTTFRLQLTGKGLGAALAEAASNFTARCGVPVELDDDLLGVELSANEQIHVLQIVREALANVEHHARASQARVSLRCPRDAGAAAPSADAARGRIVDVTIEDDGVGISDATSPRNHFGLSIMGDRARALDGTLEVGPLNVGPNTGDASGRPGTRVRLRFPPKAPFAAPTAPAALHSHDAETPEPQATRVAEPVA